MKKVFLIGGGAANLVVADLWSKSAEVHIFEKGKMLGRKFLVAGKGGFNLTNAAIGKDLLQHYAPTVFFEPILKNFDSEDTRKWLETLGIPTYTGSSGRVFPQQGIKPYQVLNALKNRLIRQGVQFHFHHEFIGFTTDCQPIVRFDDKELVLHADHYVFALGGASWPGTGSDGQWVAAFQKIGVKTLPFQASNCGVNIAWMPDFQSKQQGKPLKNIAVSIGNFHKKGEALVTEYGLEGNVIYPAVPIVRALLNEGKKPVLSLDLKPNNTPVSLLQKLQKSKVLPKNYGYIFNLNPTELALARQFCDKPTYLNPALFAPFLKEIPIPVQSLRPIKEAISTVGGIDLSEVAPNLTLKKYPHISVIGEMLDWDAPTGGFLLQASYSMANHCIF